MCYHVLWLTTCFAVPMRMCVHIILTLQLLRELVAAYKTKYQLLEKLVSSN
jgi:hypothetical protein